MIFSFFSFLKIGPKDHNQVLLGVKMHPQKVSVFVDALNFDPWFTIFWPQAALYFDPQQHLILTPKAYFQNWKKLYITISKGICLKKKEKNTSYNIPMVL